MSYTKADAIKEINKTLYNSLPDEISKVKETDSIKTKNRAFAKKSGMDKLKEVWLIWDDEIIKIKKNKGLTDRTLRSDFYRQ